MSETDCEKLLDELYQLLDGELPPERCAELQAHFEACLGCLGRHEVERYFKEFIRRRCGGQAAPPPLIDRIRTSLEREAAAVDQ